MTTITHNEKNQRFELQQDGQTAYLSYQVAGDKLVYDHTIVPSELGGQGIGSQLVKHALDYARDNGKRSCLLVHLLQTMCKNTPNTKTSWHKFFNSHKKVRNQNALSISVDCLKQYIVCLCLALSCFKPLCQCCLNFF